MQASDIGVFDHVDQSGEPGTALYETRLRLIERYDREGFHAYHCAEHHLAQSGMAPSPGLFLAAIAQRTKRLRFGPLVYQLPTYHPLRLIEEICMLDQMSGGRLELGVGRGSGAAETRYFGRGYDTAQAVYAETLDFIIKVLTEQRISFPDAPETFQDLPLQINCVQRPHPPLWYGVHSVDSAKQAAARGQNVVSLDSAADTRDYIEAFVPAFRSAHGAKALPRMGISRFIVVAETDALARDIARRAYDRWWLNFTYTARTHRYVIHHARPREFDVMQEQGKGIAGAPATVAALLDREIEVSGANYLVGQFAFGDLSADETHRSLDLFTGEVLPRLASPRTVESLPA